MIKIWDKYLHEKFVLSTNITENPIMPAFAKALTMEHDFMKTIFQKHK